MNLASSLRTLTDRERVFEFVNRPPQATRADLSHGTILYLEDITVSFDGFRALNALTLYVDCLLYTSPSPRD